MTEQNKILNEIEVVKQSLLKMEANYSPVGGWLPKNTVKRFLNYGDTQLRNLEKNEMLTVSKIGHRKFYSYDSILALINNNILK